MSDIVVFAAKKIITMDINRMEATHVAVRDGAILAEGHPTCADHWRSLNHISLCRRTTLV